MRVSLRYQVWLSSSPLRWVFGRMGPWVLCGVGCWNTLPTRGCPRCQWVSSLSVGDLGEVRIELWPLWSYTTVDLTPEHRSVFSGIYRRFAWVVTVTYPDEVEVFAAKDRRAADSLFNVLVSRVS